MGCLYSIVSGVCSLWDEDSKKGPDGSFNDTKGYCGCEDDPDPSYSCSEYESDYYCSGCGSDLNIEECDCLDE